MENGLELFGNDTLMKAIDGLQVFKNPDLGSVRITDINGDPWFVAKDVCDCLGVGNSRQATSYLDDDEKGVITNDTPGGIQEMQVVSESGLYSLILRSRKPDAKKFKRWITHEVIPAIRKTGSYSLHPALPKSYADALRELADTVEKKEAAERKLALEQEAHEITKDRLERTTEDLVQTEELRAKAVREKSWIGERREATAMATASVATRRANKLGKENEELREQIGDSTNWKTVRAYGKELEKYFILNHGCYIIIGKRLTKMSKEMGFERKDVEDLRYGTTGAYHIDVWERFFYTCKNDLNFLKKYRNTTPVCDMAA